MPARVFDSPNSPIPQLQLLSNGRYHVMITSAGGGYSRWKDLAITRWREDTTCDNWGAFCYLRDVASGVFWSNTHQPTLKPAQSYEATFSVGRAEFRRRDLDYETRTEIVVSPEDDIELRRMRITNCAGARRTVEVTSYAEIVIAPPAVDSAHPAFNKLFVETDIAHERQAILCTRRPRAPDEPTPWMFHHMAVRRAESEQFSYETDRLQFIGRGRTTADPHALHDSGALSGSAGAVLDPVAAIRFCIALEPGETATVDLISGISETREACLKLVDRYRDEAFADRMIAAEPSHDAAVSGKLRVTAVDALLYGHLAGSVIYANGALRADPAILAENRRGQSGLWGHAISGDLPIVLLQITNPANLELLRQLLRAQAYWRAHGSVVDLVILSEDRVGGNSPLRKQISKLIAAGSGADPIDQPGGIFVRSADEVDDGDRILLQTVARVVIRDGDGSLAEQLERVQAVPASFASLRTTPACGPGSRPAIEPPERDLIFRNGLGGFTADGREYVITIGPDQMTPAPWVNVLANPGFGTVISESGSAYTWSENAHEFRLTPWSNDPVGDANTEAYYLRDEESGYVWSATRLPIVGAGPYVTRHGFGYSVFEHSEEGIDSELCVFVAIDAPVKFAVLTLRNRSGRARRLSVTGYLEWVLGDERAKTRMHVITGIDPDSGALFARNAYSTDFPTRTAFFDVDDIAACSSCGDRGEFLGRNGSLRDPRAMSQPRLSGTVGAALDPCAAIRVPCALADGQTREIIFRLGAGDSADAARDLVRSSRGLMAAHDALAKVKQYWRHTLDAVQVDTPDSGLNVLANGWLVYQTLACRVWARSGFYQSGGAYGFRDQLQDTMALVHARPALVREHLLRCAGRQFPEGDAQHWWHPPAGRGVRTRISDDYLWLPLATCRYVQSTGDTGVLDQNVHFLEGRALKAGEESYYDLPGHSAETASLYQHCVRAIEHGLRFGERGLPLMGSGDWNDGMNLVGIHGKGESVWLGFFLCEVLTSFAELACRHNDPAFAKRCLQEAEQLRQNLEEHAWDGAWYRRAWFDDGSPLGSAENDDCRIDSIAQSWSVLSGGGGAERSRMAMRSLDDHLVRCGDGLIQLLDPPFDKSPMNPGYIKGYVPGVRENGGQYTHAAVWAAMAFARLGDCRRAWECFALINPLNHALTPAAVATYKAEPYVVAADVYAVAPHTGRGGWTWYTGSAGWLYRLIVESLLGLQREADRLHISPCMPADWQTYSLNYRYGDSVYRIAVVQTDTAGDATGSRTTLDDIAQGDQGIALIDDQREHTVVVRINRGEMDSP
ncbi:MAG TPA: hypothetical protein VMP00_10965 [Burkholderiales bacterium]|nr:hypothetical protein [Burkholderiales bacterium]